MSCNSTLDNLPDDTWRQGLGVLMCFVTATAAFENFIVLSIIYGYSELRTPSNKILASLALADFLTGATVAPLHAAQYLNTDIIHVCAVEEVRRYLSTALIGASTFSLGFISYDRCLHLTRLKNYNMKKRVFYPIIILCWLIPILLPFLRKIGNTEEVYSATIITIGAAILSVMVVSYVAIIISLRNYTRKSTGNMLQHSARNEKRAGVTIFIVITLYIIMLVPVFIHHGLNASKQFDKQFLAKSYSIAIFLAITNSSINPLIYCYRTGSLRKYIHRLFVDIVKRSEESEDVRTDEIGAVQSVATVNSMVISEAANDRV